MTKYPLTDLSNDLIASSLIYDRQLRDQLTGYHELKEEFEKRKLGHIDVAKAIDSLFDQGIIRSSFRKRPDGTSIHAYDLQKEALEFVKYAYGLIDLEKVVVSSSTTSSEKANT